MLSQVPIAALTRGLTQSLTTLKKEVRFLHRSRMRKQLYTLIVLVASVTIAPALDYPLAKPRIAAADAAGKPAPDFALRDQDGKELKLSSLRGKRVLLLFYRAHW
jgi:hypothetical protein